ncbi:MAG: dihydrodipicolinate synthase family protein [Eubacteriales bacterium]|nr:dihydrodipicolinate synthase family protein [Eubacteriales bacterium]
MKNPFPGGVWPVMLTPFTEENRVDFAGLEALIEWYIRQGVDGLFAVTQSSEMFFLSLEERVQIATFVKEKAAGRVPVIASGHIADSIEEQVLEVRRMAQTGVDAVILITNRLAKEGEDDGIWMKNMEKLLERIPDGIRLGLYECPYPYKRVLNRKLTEWCAQSGRFYFLKDTSCDLENIRMKLKVCEGSLLKLYNANTATLLESLREGAAGYSGVMANMQCKLYVKLMKDFERTDMEALAERLTICALIERQWYPSNAKYYLSLEGLPILMKCRVQDASRLTSTWKKEVRMLRNITGWLEDEYLQRRDGKKYEGNLQISAEKEKGRGIYA